jgi:hypothetical protein
MTRCIVTPPLLPCRRASQLLIFPHCWPIVTTASLARLYLFTLPEIPVDDGPSACPSWSYMLPRRQHRPDRRGVRQIRQMVPPDAMSSVLPIVTVGTYISPWAPVAPRTNRNRNITIQLYAAPTSLAFAGSKLPHQITQLSCRQATLYHTSTIAVTSFPPGCSSILSCA